MLMMWYELNAYVIMYKGYEIINEAIDIECACVCINKHRKQCNTPWDGVWSHRPLALNKGGYGDRFHRE